MASKGKGAAGKDKRKRGAFDDDKTGGGRKKNRSVLQFFEDEAGVADSDSSFDIDELFDDDDLLFDFDSEPAVKSDPGRSEQFRGVFPKEEELSGDELEQMLEERYRSGSGYVRYAEDGYDSKRSVDRSFLVPSAMEPGLWKVKCKVGRERHTVFCLMQKYVDLKVLGTKLQIISAFTAEHIKGFVFIEAEKQSDVAEACNQLADVYFSLMTQVPPNEISQLLVVRKRCNEVKEGTWARVKNGIYRGDIAQVVAFNNERKRATVKLIPRVDMQALAAKYGGAGGKSTKKSKRAIPAARLISSTDLDEFRPLMQCRRDRDTGKIFEFLDGLMLKDGFVYKKVSIDSLSFWDVKPTEEELQKFTLPTNDESDNLEWLSQLYGEQKKKNNVPLSKGGEKGEGSSGSNEQSSFEVHDLVLFGKREFGMVIGMEKDEDYKILQCAAEGPKTLNLGQKDLKYVPLDKKFTALDLHMKTISINDTVKILHGPSKDRQGTVKQIYRGIIFLYDEIDFENAYFCAKSQEAEKVRHIDSFSRGKDEGGPSGFEDAPSSPKSPLAARRPWQMREDDRGDKDGMFSIGQSLRIRIGPLKGYLCRVLAVRYSDVTVKLDSQQKVLTVKREHLSEVRGKGSSTTAGDDTGLDSSFRPFDLLGSDGNANGWLQGASGTTDGDGWNVGGHSGERTAWPSFSSSGALIQGGTSAGAGTGPVDNDSGKDADGWLSKANNSGNSSWGAGNNEVAGSSAQAGGWGSSDGGWGKSGTGASNSWDNSKVPVGDQGGSWNAGSNMDRGKEVISDQPDPWDKGKKIANETGSWGKQTTDKGLTDSWNKGQGDEEAGGWNSKVSNAGASSNEDSKGWGQNSDKESKGWGQSGGPTESNKLNSMENSSDRNNDSGGWKQQTSWDKGKVGDDSNSTWGKDKNLDDKTSEDASNDAWGKVAEKWGNQGSSSKAKEWKSSADAAEGDKGKGWGDASNSQDGGGWKSSGDTWSKPKSFGGDGSGGNDSWGQSRSFDSDRGGFGGGRGSGGRRGRGRDGFGRGRGRSFDRGGNSSSWGKDDQDSGVGASWSKEQGGSLGNSSWGKEAEGGASWSKDQGGSWGGSNGNKDNTQEAGSWSKNQGGSWGNASSGSGQGNTWGGSKSEEKNATGGGWNKGGGSDSSGWNKDSDGPSWTKDQGGSSGNASGGSGQGNTWGGSKSEEKNATGGGWNKGGGSDSGGWNKGSDGGSWSKDQGGSWGNASGGSGQVNTWGGSKSEENNASGGGWNKGSDGGGSWSKDQGGSWGNASAAKDGPGNTWGGAQSEDKNVTGGGWSKGGGSDSGGWNKDNDGGSWSKPGNDTWDKPSNFENDQGGRGSGGRRGRGGFRGGRDGGFRGGRDGGFRGGRDGGFRGGRDGGYRGGRDGGFRGGRGGGFRGGRSGGRDQDGDQFSSWKSDDQGGSSSWGNASGGNSWSQGWSNSGGDDKSGSKPTEGTSQGSWGQGSSWGNSSGGNDQKATGQGSSWGNSSGGNDQKATGQGSSWGNSSGGNDQKATGQGSSWGNSSGGNDQKATGQGSSWGNSSGGSDQKASGQGSSWGNSSGGNNQNSSGQGSSWGNSGGNNQNTSGQGSSWGNSGGNNGQKEAGGGNSSWGASSSGGGGGWA